MGNEMGNNNVSGLQEEEKSGVEEAPQMLLHEAVHAEEVKGENNTNSEAEQRDFCEKVGDYHVEKQKLGEKEDTEEEDNIKPVAEGKESHEAVFPSDTPLGAGELHVEKQTSDENEENDTELKPPAQNFQIPTKSNDAASLGSGVRNASSDISDDKDEKTLEMPNLAEDLIGTNETHIQKEIAVGREDIETSTSAVDSKSESHEVDLKSDQHEAVHAEPVEDGSRVSPGDSEELIGLSTSLIQAENGHLVDNEMTEKIDLYVVSGRDDQNIANELDDLVDKTQASEEDNLVESETCDDKCEVFCREETEKSLRKECDGESPPEVSASPLEASESPLQDSKSPLDAFPRPTSINSFQEVSQPLEKSIVLTEENKLVIGSEMENGENKFDSNQTRSSEEGNKYFETESNASELELLTMESDCKESVKENALCSGIGEGCRVEESEVNSNEPQVIFVDQNLKPYFGENSKMEKSMLLTEETTSIGSDLESGENKCDCNQTQFCDQALKDLKADDFNASQSELMTIESDCKMNEKESALKFNSQVEDPEMNHNENQVGFADKNLKSDFVEQLEESDGISDKMPEHKTIPTVLNVTYYKHGEDRPTEGIEDQDKDSHAKRDDRDKGDMAEQCMSWPFSTKHVQDFPPQVLDSEADENGKVLISHSEQNGRSEFFIITETLNVCPDNAQAMLSTPEKEHPQIVETTSVMIAESETPPIVFDEQNAKPQESVEKLIPESNSETSSIHVELGKSPSFHFDLSIGARSEESDQTPLLCQDRTAARSLSSRGDARFQNDNVQTDYSPPQDEAVSVEAKTIRRERSDSEKPNAPFLSLLKKEENAEVLVAQESHAADKKATKDSWTVTTKQVVLTSPRDGARKRKPRPSLFTTCICCANAIR